MGSSSRQLILKVMYGRENVRAKEREYAREYHIQKNAERRKVVSVRKARTARTEEQKHLDHLLWLAGKRAKCLGILIVSDKAMVPSWWVYDAATGKQLLTYHPVSRTWCIGPRRGDCKNWREMLTLAKGSIHHSQGSP